MTLPAEDKSHRWPPIDMVEMLHPKRLKAPLAYTPVCGLVTTIIPVYNRPEQLRDAVNSVLAQSYRPIEILIVDDGSTDETRIVAQRIEQQNPNEVRVLIQMNAGPGIARELGRINARGEFIQYLDSDDVLLPNKFELQVNALRAEPTAGVAYGKTRFRRADGTVQEGPLKWTGEKRTTMFPSFLQLRWWSTSTPLYRAAVCAAAGPWTSLRIEEDWEMDCRVAALDTKLVWCSDYVSETRDHFGARLSGGSRPNPEKLRMRARAHELILQHAMKAGISASSEMQHFARELFLLSRQCGACGLAHESRRLFLAARTASGPARANHVDFRVYGAMAQCLGWRVAGTLGNTIDLIRNSQLASIRSKKKQA